MIVGVFVQNFIARSSSQLLFVAMGVTTWFLAYPIGGYQMATWFIIGNLISGMFVNVSDPSQYVWLFQKTIGIFENSGLSRGTQDFLSLSGAWLAVSLISFAMSVGYTYLHILLRRALYGVALPERTGRYFKISVLLNFLFSLSFFSIGYGEFMNSPSITFGGSPDSSYLFIVSLAFFAVWWIQHILNQYACGIKIMTHDAKENPK